MKVVFCGTPEFAVPTLEAVVKAGHEVALVVTQPDRAAGRGMEIQAPPVKKRGTRAAESSGVSLRTLNLMPSGMPAACVIRAS